MEDVLFIAYTNAYETTCDQDIPGGCCLLMNNALLLCYSSFSNKQDIYVHSLLSFWVIFLMARTVPPSFVEIGPKLRVVAPLKWEWPKTAKNRGEPQKMTPSSETENFLGVVPM